jgi:hypothetical protein
MPSVTLTRIPIAMKDREPEFFDVIQPIVFGVTVLGRDHTGHVGNLTVVVDGLSLFTLTSFPLSDLARQAALWSVAVDDADHCTAFIYRDEQDCPATIKTDPRRQLELTPDRVVLRGGRGALRHAV